MGVAPSTLKRIPGRVCPMSTHPHSRLEAGNLLVRGYNTPSHFCSSTVLQYQRAFAAVLLSHPSYTLNPLLRASKDLSCASLLFTAPCLFCFGVLCHSNSQILRPLLACPSRVPLTLCRPTPYHGFVVSMPV